MAQQFAGYDGQSFSIGVLSGVMAAGLAANSEIIQFRWVDTTNLRRVRVLGVDFSAVIDVTGFTAGAALFDIVAARAFTVAGTGGTAQTLTGNNQKLRTSQNPNILGASGEIRVATTAALGAGTKTLDAQGLGAVVGAGSATAGSLIVAPAALYKDVITPAGQPLVLAHNEGFAVRATVPATGTWRFAATIYWAEAD